MNLLKETSRNIKISKEILYRKSDMKNKLKQLFILKIESIYLINKFSEETINIKKNRRS
jgi:hypothetical protein